MILRHCNDRTRLNILELDKSTTRNKIFKEMKSYLQDMKVYYGRSTAAAMKMSVFATSFLKYEFCCNSYNLDMEALWESFCAFGEFHSKNLINLFD